jgi:hypothetical protein
MLKTATGIAGGMRLPNTVEADELGAQTGTRANAGINAAARMETTRIGTNKQIQQANKAGNMQLGSTAGGIIGGMVAGGGGAAAGAAGGAAAAGTAAAAGAGGAAAGAAAGSVVPVVGTLIGAAIGALIGGAF